MTTRVYDMRYHKKSLVTLPAVLGAIRSVRFSDDGAFLAAAEPADFVHVYDIRSGFVDKTVNSKKWGEGAFRSQVIDFFGEIAGISFTPDGADSLYIGNAGLFFFPLLYYSRHQVHTLTIVSVDFGCIDERYGAMLEFKRSSPPDIDVVEDMVF
jgi:WD40 repeat protein